MIFFPSAILNYIEVFIAVETISIIHDHAKKNTCFHDKSTLYLIGEAVDLSFRIRLSNKLYNLCDKVILVMWG